ncbi:PAS domain-containing sensor histidine kinase [Methanospirillum hungatei]|uniref:PAS domain-containing sensor histidine kinase n=1 Tax=Methanospirillum hungatei TaxID=2203 RepID=UPI0026F0C77E|nr:PAS domain-containing sensor histidine kinase [Methanospirillum hungatei]MCA1917496.1 PAS domain-containing sensor histidine kinase [Methanospirillum hungatei]
MDFVLLKTILPDLLLILILIAGIVYYSSENLKRYVIIIGSIGCLAILSGGIAGDFSDLFSAGLSVHIIGEILICCAILLMIASKKASEPDKNLETKISELERQLLEKTEALDMTNILLKNELEVRSSFEADLQESEEKFRNITEITPLGMILVNRDNSIAYINPQVTRSLGFTLDDLPDMQTLIRVFLPDPSDQEEAYHMWREQVWKIDRQIQEPLPRVYQITAKDASQRTFEVYFAPYGKVMLILLHDITIRKKAQDELRESERRYREMIENVPLIVVMLNPDGTVVFGNNHLLKVIGCEKEEILGADWFSTYTPPEEHVRDTFIQYIQEEKVPPQLEYSLISKNNHKHSVLWTNLVLQESDGRFTGVISLGTDITERIQREKAIQLANKKLNILSSISRHDIANTLTEIFLTLELAQDTIEDTASQELIHDTLDGLRIIRRQIEFSRYYQDIGVHAPEWFDLETIITLVVREMALSDITVTIETGKVMVYSDPLIQKVFFNLIDNSLRHGKQVTKISFTLIHEGSDLIIVYSDDGAGISYDEKEKIFERGFGKNTGMGLFLIRDILAITGLSIRECGTPGKGARFEITVPKGAWQAGADKLSK